jgi:hypothetical protein
VRTLRIDEIEGQPVLGTLRWQPVRRPLGITAFGINAYTAAEAGDEVVEDHTEQTHEEAYIVIRGHATFTVDGDEIDAPWGTIVFLDDPAQRRHAIAKEAGTTVLAVGGEPGVHTISSWEYIFPSLPARNVGDWDTARTILEEALAEHDIPAIRYHLAAVEAQAGNADRALEELQIACDARPDYIAQTAKDEEFDSIRGDPRFPR